MKTWFNYIFFLVFASAVPFIVGLLPTIEAGGRFFGGGPVRQYFVNLMVHLLPAEKSDALVNKFMSGGMAQEYLLYLPIALNLALICFLMGYCVCSIFMTINNSYLSNKFHSQRHTAKTTR